ncbi:MAG: carbon-nitrogen hydrolase family protein [Oscillospiraceae bacterium]
MDFSKWKKEVPYLEVMADVHISENQIGINTSGKHYLYAKVKAPLVDIKEKSVYNFKAEIFAKNIEYKILFTWFDSEESQIARGYLKDEDTCVSPPKAKKLEIAILGFSSEMGEMLINDVNIDYLKEYIPKTVTMAAIHIDYNPPRTCAMNLKETLDKLDEVAKEKPDVVVLTEGMYDRRCDVSIEKGSLTLNDEPIRQLKEKARENHYYIALSLHLKRNGLFYNTGMLIDRKGEIVGMYDKSHLTMAEIEEGMPAGNRLPVFETDFGKVGIVICWDMWFPEMTRVLYEKGVDIILNPTAGFCDYQSRACAMNNGVYVVTSGVIERKCTRILNPYGEVIADAKENGIAIAKAVIKNPNYVFWLSVGEANGDGKNLYHFERRPKLYTTLIKNET